MSKALLFGMLAGFSVYLISTFAGLKTHIGGDLMAAAYAAAAIATSEERKRHHPFR